MSDPLYPTLYVRHPDGTYTEAEPRDIPARASEVGDTDPYSVEHVPVCQGDGLPWPCYNASPSRAEEGCDLKCGHSGEHWWADPEERAAASPSRAGEDER